MHSTLARYIIKESSVNFVTNAFFNGLIAWLLLRGGPDLTMWGEHSFAIDLMATAFILLLIVTLIVVPLQRRKVRSGKMNVLLWDPGCKLHRCLQRFPASLWAKGVVFGLIGLVVFIPLTLAPLAILGVTHFTPASYAVFKGLWAGVLAAVLMGPMIMLGLAAPSKTSSAVS
jgi:hypothetical protein